MDKLKKREEEIRLTNVQKMIDRRPVAFPVVLAVSATKGVGIDELRAEILAACNQLPVDRGVVLPPHLLAAIEEQQKLKKELEEKTTKR